MKSYITVKLTRREAVELLGFAREALRQEELVPHEKLEALHALQRAVAKLDSAIDGMEGAK